MPASEAYRRIVLDHNRSPRRRGRLTDPSITVEGVNPLCGDHLRLDLQIQDETLSDFAYAGEASALTLAACSLMGDLVVGKSLTQIEQLAQAALDLLTANPQAQTDPRLGDFNAFLGLLDYPNRIKTITLPWATLLGALKGRTRISTDVDIRGGSYDTLPMA